MYVHIIQGHLWITASMALRSGIIYHISYITCPKIKSSPISIPRSEGTSCHMIFSFADCTLSHVTCCMSPLTAHICTRPNADIPRHSTRSAMIRAKESRKLIIQTTKALHFTATSTSSPLKRFLYSHFSFSHRTVDSYQSIHSINTAIIHSYMVSS